MNKIFFNERKINQIFMTKESFFDKDERANYSLKPIRMIRDETTSTYVSKFLSDKKKRIDFINYTFNTINTHIQLNINKLLSKEENAGGVLKGNENVYLVFKGGNVMNYYFDKLINSLSIIDRKDFKISDVDYSIYIILNDNYTSEQFKRLRYNTIKKHVFTLLIFALNKISNVFNLQFNDVINDIETLDAIDNTPTSSYKLNEDCLIGIKSKFKSFKILFDNNIDIDDTYDKFIDFMFRENPISLKECRITNPTWFDYINIMINNINTTYLIDLLYIYNIIHNILIIKHNDDLDNLLKLMEEKITIFTNNKLVNKIKKFYKKDDLEDFIKNQLPKNLKDLFNNKIKVNGNNNLYEVIDNKLIIYNFDSIDTTKPLECSYEKKKNNFITFDGKNIDILESERTYNHYVTYNSIIYPYNIKNDNNEIINSVKFDLARIKFNVALSNIQITKIIEDLININYFDNTDYENIEIFNKNNLNIPSEFIDVSIPDYIDTSYMHYVDELKEYNYEPHVIIDVDNELSIYSYSLSQLSQDLDYVLFMQNVQILPWLDIKYEKRINRLILFSLINSYFTLKENKYLYIHKIYELVCAIRDNDKIKIDNICKECVENNQEYRLYYRLSDKDYIIHIELNKRIFGKHNEYGGNLFLSILRNYDIFCDVEDIVNKDLFINNYNKFRFRLVKYLNTDEAFYYITAEKVNYNKFILDIIKILEPFVKGDIDTILKTNIVEPKVKNILFYKNIANINITNKYKNKYLKYKQKYINLKNNTF